MRFIRFIVLSFQLRVSGFLPRILVMFDSVVGVSGVSCIKFGLARLHWGGRTGPARHDSFARESISADFSSVDCLFTYLNENATRKQTLQFELICAETKDLQRIGQYCEFPALQLVKIKRIMNPFKRWHNRAK